MNKIITLLTLGMALSPHWQMQDDSIEACVASCRVSHGNLDVQREEIINLEKETVRAIHLRNTAFFSRRNYCSPVWTKQRRLVPF